MAKKQFKTESKKLLDMMVNSIYTHKEIFLRELISNASDAIDKLYFRSLTDPSVTLGREDYEIRLAADREARTLTVRDNGCGMTREELESNLGTIAKSGSLDFKRDPDTGKEESIDIIGQFGVGFYSAFMVAEKLVVESRAHGAEEAWRWSSTGADGYTVESCEKPEAGTCITIYLKPDGEEERYGEFLEEHRLRGLVSKYSDYIRYPIRMLVTRSVRKEGTEDEYESVIEDQTLNSMIPLWKKSPAEVDAQEYAEFYKSKFSGYEDPLRVIRQKAEGGSNYVALLFVPARAPFDYYSKGFEKGLQLYSSGVLIMDKCKDLLPDHFSFVQGLVDSADLSLNISREMLQHDRQLKIIAKALEKKIASELKKMLAEEREKYERFFSVFGAQLKWGVYAAWGANKELLQDLLLFTSSAENKYVTLAEYTGRMREGQDKIYFAAGESAEQIARLPQVESVVGHGYEVLYLSEDVDEFCLQMLQAYADKSFLNVCTEQLDLGDEAEKEKRKAENEKAQDLFACIKESLGDTVARVRLGGAMQGHPVCLSSEGALSMGMEKVLNRMPGAEDNRLRAELVLEINAEHPIYQKLCELYESDRERLAKYSRILYAQARLVSGLSVEDPAELSRLVCELLV